MMSIGQVVDWWYKMLESSLWQLVKRNLPGHVIRVENTSGSGTPDVNACLNGKDVWVELKMAKGKWVHFRTSQVAWITKRAIGQTGSCKILVRKDDTLMLIQGSDLIKSLQHAVPNKDKSCKIPIAEIISENFVKPWHWPTITEKVYA